MALQIARSVRIRSGGYFSRTPGAASNRKTFTISSWVKRGTSGGPQAIFSAGAAGVFTDGGAFWIDFTSGDAFDVTTGSTDLRTTSALYRDYAKHDHFVVAVDTTQATAANRIRTYINGVEHTSYSINNNVAQNIDLAINNTIEHRWGANVSDARLFEGYLSDCYLIDGQQLTPSSFGQADATTGAWVPIAYTGSYGTNGHHLTFSDNSAATAAAIGADSSGNGNNFTPSGISITAGVTNDSLTDTPTNYGTDTGAGGEVRGNYCTWNKINPATNYTLSNGNLKAAFVASHYAPVVGTFPMSSGKWVWENTVTMGSFGPVVGVVRQGFTPTDANYIGQDANGFGYYGPIAGTAQKFNGSGGVSYGAVWASGDVIRCEFDADNHQIEFFKNGTSQGVAFTGMPSDTYFPACCGDQNVSSVETNFGQRPFVGTPTAGFKALCTQNLPDPAILKPSQYFDVNLRAGTGSAGSVSGKGFQPDLVWSKSRSARSHMLADSVRGTTKYISSDSTGAQTTDAQSVTAFNSDGFSFGTSAILNTNAENFVDWLWKKAALCGVDVVSYTGNGANRTIAHSLGVAPSLMVLKDLAATADWKVWHTALAGTDYLAINTTAAKANAATVWNSTTPTSSVFSLGTASDINTSGNAGIAYLFADVAGFSKAFSYTGNGSTDGPFVWCGFKPRFVMVKRTDTTNNWVILDTARDTYNAVNHSLYPNLNNAEDTAAYVHDFLANGFKLRDATAGGDNVNGGTYVGMAFAEMPFKYASAPYVPADDASAYTKTESIQHVMPHWRKHSVQPYG